MTKPERLKRKRAGIGSNAIEGPPWPSFASGRFSLLNPVSTNYIHVTAHPQFQM